MLLPPVVQAKPTREVETPYSRRQLRLDQRTGDVRDPPPSESVLGAWNSHRDALEPGQKRRHEELLARSLRLLRPHPPQASLIDDVPPETSHAGSGREHTSESRSKSNPQLLPHIVDMQDRPSSSHSTSFGNDSSIDAAHPIPIFLYFSDTPTFFRASVGSSQSTYLRAQLTDSQSPTPFCRSPALPHALFGNLKPADST